MKTLSLKTSTCSFCGTTDRPCVESAIAGTCICYLCIQNGDEIAGNLPLGAVRCTSCKAITSFVVKYKNGTVHYSGGSLDINGVFQYVVRKVEGDWDETQLKEKAKCGCCNADVPLYLFSRSEYIR